MTVLVGVDGSVYSRTALRWAATWATASEQPLVAVASWQYPHTAALPGGPELASPEVMDEVSERGLREVLAEELGDGAGAVEVEVLRGPASWALLEAARRHQGWLLVVGKRGLGPLEGRLLGSVSRRVAELSPTPVVIVPNHELGSGPIVVGVDGSDAANAAVDWAIEAAKVDGSQVLLVHGLTGLPAEIAPSAIDRFVSQAHELVDGLALRVTQAGVDAETYVDVADPRALLREVADRRDARMIVVGAHGDGPVAGVLIGSVVSHIAQQSDQPVVVVPPRR